MAKSLYLAGTDFSENEIQSAVKEEKALVLAIFFGYGCTLACKMCYAGGGKDYNKMIENEKKLILDFNDYDNLLKQAKEEGIKVIGISGEGETMINLKEFFKLVDMINDYGFKIVAETNGVNIDREVAERLCKSNVSVIGKLFSLNPKMNDFLVGKSGIYKYMELDGEYVPEHIKHLKDVGMTEQNKLAVNTVITQYNYDEIERILEWTRKNSILPHFELLIPMGFANDNDDLAISEEKRYEIHKKVYELDKKLGYDYEFSLGLYPGPRKCDNRFIIMVDLYGFSKVCACTYIQNGSIRTNSLKELIKKHYEIEKKLGRVYANDTVYCDCINTMNKIKTSAVF